MTFPYNQKTGTTDPTVQQQIDQLNERLKLLESVLRVSASEVQLTVPNRKLTIDVGGEAVLRAATAMRIHGSAEVSVQGGIIRLN